MADGKVGRSEAIGCSMIRAMVPGAGLFMAVGKASSAKAIDPRG